MMMMNVSQNNIFINFNRCLIILFLDKKDV